MGIRVERLKEVIREVSAEVILRELNDPRIGFVTVTHVDLTSDLQFATLYVSVFGDDAEKRKTLHGLKNAKGLIQSRVAKAMQTRTTPTITIELDESLEKAMRMEEKIRQARATDMDGGASTSPASSQETVEDGEAVE